MLRATFCGEKVGQNAKNVLMFDIDINLE